MNNQDKSSYPGLDALRGERAPVELQSKIMRALQSEQRNIRTAKYLKFSLATVVAIAFISLAILAPRISFASAISKVLKAFQSVGIYHVRSYQVVDGNRRLVSDTWVDGNKRKVTLYGPDGEAIPNSGQMGDMAAKLDKLLRGLTPQQLLDPKLKDKLNDEIGTLGPNSGFMMERITIDGREVTDLPAGMKQAIRDQMFKSAPMFSLGGQGDITYLLGLLRDPKIWDIAHDQMINGKTVEKCQVKNGDKRITLLVDPATSLPISLQMNTSLLGEEVTVTDEFDYPAAGP
jgi:hypothetical protein